jgi:hypothetical protein
MKPLLLTVISAALVSSLFAQQHDSTGAAQSNNYYVAPQKQQRSMPTSEKHARINLYGAYVFDDDFESYYSDYDYYHGTLEGGFMGGAGIEFVLHAHKSY